MFKTLRDFDFKAKKVLLRVDFNVPLNEKGEIIDDFRIKAALPTIEYLIKGGAKIILMTHLGRPKGKVVAKLKLDKIREKLREYLDLSITKPRDCLDRKIGKLIEEMEPGEVLLLENLRFHKGEEENDPQFTKNLAKLGEIYVNDAFGCSHRAHASIVGLAKYLPSAAGFLLEKEIKVLSQILEKPWRPLVVIIGGTKIETKLGLIERFLKIADEILLGGEIANIILRVKGINIGKPLPFEEEIIKKIDHLRITDPKIHLPCDVITSENHLGQIYLRSTGPGGVRKEEAILDIGQETIAFFSEIIKTAKMIFWNGPLGLFENKNFERGTREIAQAISRNFNAFKVAGGGETILAINQFNLADKFDHLSTGGGACLAFLAGKKLPGLEALGYYSKK